MTMIALKINGETVTYDVEPRTSLADFIREYHGLTGPHTACEHGVCGACTVRVNEEIVRGCLMLATQADGAEVITIEGLSDSGEVKDLQDQFHKSNSLQCGFCTPGMLLAAADLLKTNPTASRQEIREFLSGNYCRCTGYQAIVDAVEAVGQLRNGGSA